VSQNFPEIERRLRLQATERLEALRLQDLLDNSELEDIKENRHRDLINRLDDLSLSAASKTSKR
jgi:hypothetical protein